MSECDHQNVAKILEASFDGVISKYPINNDISSPLAEERDKGELKTQDECESSPKFKKTFKVCYYVMKLAEYGELFRFIEHTDRFSERLARSIFH